MSKNEFFPKKKEKKKKKKKIRKKQIKNFSKEDREKLKK